MGDGGRAAHDAGGGASRCRAVINAHPTCPGPHHPPPCCPVPTLAPHPPPCLTVWGVHDSPSGSVVGCAWGHEAGFVRCFVPWVPGLDVGRCRSPQSPAQVSEVFCTAAFDVPISPLAVTWVADNVDTLPVVRSAAAWRSVSLPHGDADVRYRDFGRLGEGLKVGDVGALRTTGSPPLAPLTLPAPMLPQSAPVVSVRCSG